SNMQVDVGFRLRIAPSASSVAEQDADEVFRFVARTRAVEAEIGQPHGCLMQRMKSKALRFYLSPAIERETRKVLVHRHFHIPPPHYNLRPAPIATRGRKTRRPKRPIR